MSRRRPSPPPRGPEKKGRRVPPGYGEQHAFREDRRGEHEHIAFDFLGYTFQPRRAKNHRGKYFVSFLPAISTKSAKSIRATIRKWRMASTRNNQSLEDLAVGSGLDELLRSVLPLEVCPSPALSQQGHGSMGATEVQAAEAPRASLGTLAGAHCTTGPEAICPVATWREAGGWIVGAG